MRSISHRPVQTYGFDRDAHSAPFNPRAQRVIRREHITRLGANVVRRWARRSTPFGATGEPRWARAERAVERERSASFRWSGC
jgi:hypothetical protein